jgi:hypothetical protein
VKRALGLPRGRLQKPGEARGTAEVRLSEQNFLPDRRHSGIGHLSPMACEAQTIKEPQTVTRSRTEKGLAADEDFGDWKTVPAGEIVEYGDMKLGALCQSFGFFQATCFATTRCPSLNTISLIIIRMIASSSTTKTHALKWAVPRCLDHLALDLVRVALNVELNGPDSVEVLVAGAGRRAPDAPFGAPSPAARRASRSPHLRLEA